MPSSSPMPKLVLVTGANGYIGSSLIQSLLEQGFNVRGTVRDVSNESKTATLKSMPNASTNLELVSLELTGPIDAFGQALQGVEWIFHTASPVTIAKVKDEQTIIEPAVTGTLNMLRAANASSSSVTKFVLTSSVAAIAGGHEDDKTSFTEDDWTNLEGKHVSAYAKSKTLAEQGAWTFMKENSPSFTLSVINPAVVLGPVTSSNVTSSVELLTRLLGGQDSATINLFFHIVDVRDVVKAHIQAAKLPGAAGKRFILCQSDGGELFMPEIGAVLEKEFGPMGYEVPTRVIPKCLVWLLSWISPDLAIWYHWIDNQTHFDNSRSREILQIEYIPAEQTIVDGGYSLIEHGIIPKKPGYKSP